ncbi:13657_t:CDS:2 [Dentiscutata heterogama]|uniref:13657_t:CDS:1 n=1 Tax=Dentiscutata heterogama TaxID=1316150 RepID=A0ACA9K854_9GLOM|nr:13657_t:CDS:2 [Dentiscutata heterogama]
MSSQFSRIVKLLLEESLDAICSASVVYLAMVDNILDEYEDVRYLAERVVKKALKEINNSNRREKIEENLEALNSKLGAPISNKDASLYDALKKGIEK